MSSLAERQAAHKQRVRARKLTVFYRALENMGLAIKPDYELNGNKLSFNLTDESEGRLAIIQTASDLLDIDPLELARKYDNRELLLMIAEAIEPSNRSKQPPAGDS